MGFKFSRLGNARSFADRCEKPQMIILGDDGMFWVVTMAIGARLIREGYEVI